MPPLTLTVLTSVLQMHGAGATIESDNKGIEGILAPILAQVNEGDPRDPTIKLADYNKYYYPYGKYYGKSGYAKVYYVKNIARSPGGGPPSASPPHNFKR